MSETFGRFQLDECLGRGGMGEVYRAYDPQQRRLVAIKRLWTRGLDEDERNLLAKRLAQEADAMAGLAIPNVLPVFESGRIDGQPYIVMPYVRGRDLAQVLQDGPLAPRRAVAVLGQLATALDFTHAAGLVHRDVKPSNVLLVEHPGGRDAVYLLDYGIARAVSGVTRTNRTSGIIGTLAYIAPERLDGQEASTDGRVDVYALACVLFESLTGRQPYPGLSEAAVLWAHARAPIPLPGSVDPALAAFDPVVRRGMAKQPDERFGTAGELAHAAEDALRTTGHPIPSRGPRPSGTPSPAAPRGGAEPTVRAQRPIGSAPPPTAPATGATPGRPPVRRWPVVAGLAAVVAATLIALLLWQGARGPSGTDATAPGPATDQARDQTTDQTTSPTPPGPAAPAASIAIPTISGEPVPVNPTPGHIDVAPNGRYAYIANRDEGILTVFDTTASTVTGTIPIEAGPPRYTAFSPEGRTAYVVISNADYTVNAVAFVDTGTNTVTRTVPIGLRPYAPAVSPDGRLLYVPLHNEGRVAVLDTTSGDEVASYPVAPNPHWVAISGDGRRAYTANHESNVVSVLDLTDDGRVLSTIPVGRSPHSLALSPDGTRLAVVNFESHDVSTIDTATAVVLSTVAVGRNPQDVTYAPDGRHLYTADVDSGTVSVVDTTGNRVTASIPTGDGPTSVSVLPDGRQALVTNLHAGTVRVLQTSAE